MELSTEQYKQVLRYVDGEMDTAEQKAFEALIAANKELYEEVEFYKELQSASEAYGQKPGNNDSDSEKVRKIISQARQQWETEHENEVHARIRSINRFKWLAAAIITGILLGGAWWYLQNNDLSTAANNKNQDTLNTILPPSPPSQTDNSEKIAEDPANTQNTVPNDSPRNRKEGPSTISGKNIGFATVSHNDSIRLQNIFARNFKPDLAPADTIGSLRRAFAHYNEGDYKTAILDFDKSQSLIKRGAGEAEHTAYYIHYYRGLSYLAIDSVKKAIFNLKIAIDFSPDNLFTSQAKWYQALAYLKALNSRECATLLRQLSSDNEAGEYQQKARSLMKELKLVAD